MATVTISVADAATALSVAWAPPASDNGYDVDSYDIEWWRGSGRDEVEVVQIDAVALNVSGTFTLSYEGAVTGHLPCDVDALDLENALEALDTLRDVHVERAVEGGANYSWTVTFLTEWPAQTDSKLVIDSSGLYSVNSTVRARVGAAAVARVADQQLPPAHPDGGAARLRRARSNPRALPSKLRLR